MFCCLGVLCDIYAKETGVSWDKSPPKSLYEEVSILPIQVAAWAGLQDQNPSVSGLSLAEHNDGGKTFSEIADMIEGEL